MSTQNRVVVVERSALKKVRRTLLRDVAEALAGSADADEVLREVTNAFERMSEMAEASLELSSSLDLDETLVCLTRLATRRLCDVCEVDLLEEDQTLRHAAVEHIDPAKTELVRELRRRYPESRALPLAVARSGRSELVPEVTDTMRTTLARDDEHLALLRAIGVRSLMIIPMIAHDRVLGTIGLGSSRPGRRYGAGDVLAAEDLGRRAAIAVANALLYRQAQEANQFKDDFLATVSHELRTPLTAILGWAHLLGSPELAGVKREHGLEAIQRNAVAQRQLVDDLLDVTRITSGKLCLEIRPAALTEITRAAVESSKPAMDAKSLQLHCEFDGDAGLVNGDPDRLRQVVCSLLGNAIKFTPTGGRITIRVARVDSHVELSLRDNGVGIEPRFLPHIFERFKQADGRITRVHGGLGLGLAISRHLVEMHGGTLEAHSEGLGSGATFTCRIPLLPAEPPARGEPT